MNRLLRAGIFSLLPLFSVPLVQGQADFRYYVFDEIQNDDLNIEIEHDLAIRDSEDVEGCPAGPWVIFWRRYRIYGVAQPNFTYVEEEFGKNVSRAAYEAFLQEVRKEPLILRDLHGIDVAESVTNLGSILIEDCHFNVPGPRGDPNREQLHGLVLAFYDQVAPEPDRKITSRTIEGDLQPARPVTLKELLANPSAFDGKRIRVSGYYHGKSHFSSLTFSKKSKMDTDQGIWINGASTFAKASHFDRANNSYVTVEGTFSGHRGGHFGAWPAEIERLTLFKKR